MQEGWLWLTYLKWGKTIATAPTANGDDKAEAANPSSRFAALLRADGLPQ